MSSELELPKVCRVCLVFTKHNQFYDVDDTIATVNTMIRDMLQLCIPEMDLELTCKPKICKGCYQKVESFYNFKNCCIETENKVRNHCTPIDKLQYNRSKTKKVDLLDVIQSNGIIISMNAKCDDEEVPVEPNKPAVQKAEHEVEVISDSDNDCEFNSYVLNGQDTPVPVKANRDVVLFSCNVCSYMTTDNIKLKKHKCFQDTKKKLATLRCNLCPTTHKNIKMLESHKFMAHAMFDCTQCSFKTRSADIINKHKQNAHVKREITYDCKSCPFKAINSTFLQKHVRAMHFQPSLLTCEFCPYETTDRSNFKKHQYTHTKDKPHKCPVCDYQCVSPYQMKKHIDKQHVDKKEFA